MQAARGDAHENADDFVNSWPAVGEKKSCLIWAWFRSKFKTLLVNSPDNNNGDQHQKYDSGRRRVANGEARSYAAALFGQQGEGGD